MPTNKNDTIVAEEVVMNKIYYLRNTKVMLDKDLAHLYGVKPIRLREQVKRNAERFPENFMFQLNEKEVELMVSQNAIPSKSQLGGHSPYVFNEHGILMLANVLKSSRAIKVSLHLIEIFVKMREMLLTHKDILLKLEVLEKQVANDREDIQMIFDAMRQLLHSPAPQRKRIGFRRKGEMDN